MKKKIVLALAFALLCCLALTPALAGGITPYYDHTGNITHSFSISGGVATCSGEVKPAQSSNKATVTVKLQQNNGGWTTIATWSGSALAGKTASASGTKSLDSGYDYRVVVSGTIKNASGTVLERPSATSAIKSY